MWKTSSNINRKKAQVLEDLYGVTNLKPALFKTSYSTNSSEYLYRIEYNDSFTVCPRGLYFCFTKAEIEAALEKEGVNYSPYAYLYDMEFSEFLRDEVMYIGPSNTVPLADFWRLSGKKVQLEKSNYKGKTYYIGIL